jgi:hypothetical protein
MNEENTTRRRLWRDFSEIFLAKAQRRKGAKGKRRVIVCGIIVVLSRFILFNDNPASNNSSPLFLSASFSPVFS